MVLRVDVLVCLKDVLGWRKYMLKMKGLNPNFVEALLLGPSDYVTPLILALPILHSLHPISI